MNIAIIGTGNVGSSLASAWAKAGHRIYLGVRKPQNFKHKEQLKGENNTSVHFQQDAVQRAEVVLLAVPAAATKAVVEQIGSIKGKIIIDAMNAVRSKIDDYESTSEALRAWTDCEDIVKCFNTTGFNIMANPAFGNTYADMFMAGNSARGKEVVRRLALDAGFEECFDAGGDENIPLLESLARLWITFAMGRGYGREIAFKLMRR